MRTDSPVEIQLTPNQCRALAPLADHGQGEIEAGNAPVSILAQVFWRRSTDKRKAGHSFSLRCKFLDSETFGRVQAALTGK